MRPWSIAADAVLTTLASGAFALAAYLLWIGWESNEFEACSVRHPCTADVGTWHVIGLIVTLAVGGAIAAWLGRALVATLWLIAVPTATVVVNGNV